MDSFNFLIIIRVSLYVTVTTLIIIHVNSEIDTRKSYRVLDWLL